MLPSCAVEGCSHPAVVIMAGFSLCEGPVVDVLCGCHALELGEFYAEARLMPGGPDMTDLGRVIREDGLAVSA